MHGPHGAEDGKLQMISPSSLSGFCLGEVSYQQFPSSGTKGLISELGMHQTRWPNFQGGDWHPVATGML